MSIQKDLTRIKNAKASIKAAIEGKGVAVPDATLLDGMAALIESIEAGGGGGGGNSVVLPENFVMASGSFVPATEESQTWDITIAKGINRPNGPAAPQVPLFALYRKDGFTASGKNSTRYLNAYVGLAGDGSYGCGAATYRNSSETDLTGSGGVESSTKNYGVPFVGSTERKNCYIRYISGDDPILRFGTFGIVTLEAGCEYAWIAVLDGSVYEV